MNQQPDSLAQSLAHKSTRYMNRVYEQGIQIGQMYWVCVWGICIGSVYGVYVWGMCIGYMYGVYYTILNIIDMLPQDSVDAYMSSFISNLYQQLSTNFQQFVQERAFTIEQDDLVQSLDPQSSKGKMFLSLLAIDAYIKHAIHLVRECEPFVQTMSLLLAGLTDLQQAMDPDSVDVREKFDDLWANIVDMCLRSHKLFPHSPLIKMQQEIIENDNTFSTVDTIYMRLRDENNSLKEKLKHSDEELIQFKQRFAKILAEEDDQGHNANELLRIVELKEELVIKEQVIKKMDLEFKQQLEKYNFVFEAMTEELQVYKHGRTNGISDNYMDQLEVNLVKLREKSARDNILINSLKAGLYEQDTEQKPSFDQSLLRLSSYYN